MRFSHIRCCTSLVRPSVKYTNKFVAHMAGHRKTKEHLRSASLVIVHSGDSSSTGNAGVAGAAAQGQVTSALMGSMTEKISEALQARPQC